ncbi:hypothetical protein KA043_01075 [Candidatus Saccharibacteria bacterium]|jgi:hypothetical protein|nr:hypothetical protein [Candidatus Saccharibacteria bacterium]
MKQLMLLALVFLFIAWAWSTDLLMSWLWIFSAGMALIGIVYHGAVMGSESLEIEGTETGLKLYWSSIGMMLFGFGSLTIITIYWSQSDDLFTLVMSALSWCILLLLIAFGFIIFYDRMITKQKLEKH